MVKLIASIISIVVCGIMAYWSYDFFIWGLAKGGTTAVFKIPLIVPQSAIPISFFLTLIYLIKNMVDDIRQWTNNKEKGIGGVK